jgi:hypothetical protein
VTAPVLLTGLAGLHVAWAAGSSWPLPDREALADAVAGRPGEPFPSPAACLAVAALLTAGAATTAGRPHCVPRVARAGSAAVSAAFAIRGVLGLAGRTDLVSPGSASPRFRRLDRRCYAPLCLVIAATSASSVRR